MPGVSPSVADVLGELDGVLVVNKLGICPAGTVAGPSYEFMTDLTVIDRGPTLPPLLSPQTEDLRTCEFQRGWWR